MLINISPCGLVCSQCDAYRATQLHDAEKLELVAADWRERYHCPDIKAERLPCDGCMTEGGRKCFFCVNACPIRPCAIAKGVKICSECGEYPCAKLTEFFNCVPEKQSGPMKKMLEAIAEVEANMRTIF